MTTMEDVLPILKDPKFLVAAGITIFLALLLQFMLALYSSWQANMGSKKVSRRAEFSPSNKSPPDIRDWQSNKDAVLESADMHPSNFANCELLYPLKDAQKPETKNKIVAERAEMTGTLSADKQVKHRRSTMRGSLHPELKSDKLDMDHVYMSFPQYVWGIFSIGFNAYYLWKKGVTILKIRIFLQKLGLLKPKPFDPAEIVGRLCLEGTMSIHYYARTQDSNIAGFFFANFPIINENGDYDTVDLFAVDIDLTTKKMVKAKMDDLALTPSEALILCWFNTISANHVKLHALANWGVNFEDEQFKKNPFPARSSLVTVIYNYFGYVTFGTYFSTWKKMGLMDNDWDSNQLKSVFDHGIDDNIWAHPRIVELAPHSRLVSFIIKARVIFMKEFAKHKDCFPGCHGEAMFVGTILHSLDHTIMDRNLEDPLWLDVDDPRFSKMAQLGRIVKVGFVQDVPGLYFHKRFKGSGHPFYDAVYQKCAKVDKDLADHMDTCIIK